MSDKKQNLIVQYTHEGSFYFAGDMTTFKSVNGFMTGEEWYDRFKKEVDEPSYQGMIARDAILLMGKRASALDKNDGELY